MIVADPVVIAHYFPNTGRVQTPGFASCPEGS